MRCNVYRSGCMPRRMVQRRRPARLGEWYRVGRALAPTDGEVRRMLRGLRAVFPELELCAVLGVSSRTVDSWRRGQHLSDGARRAVWLTWALILHPSRVRTVFDLATWGRFRKERRPLRPRSRSASFGAVVQDWSI